MEMTKEQKDVNKQIKRLKIDRELTADEAERIDKKLRHTKNKFVKTTENIIEITEKISFCKNIDRKSKKIATYNILVLTSTLVLTYINFNITQIGAVLIPSVALNVFLSGSYIAKKIEKRKKIGKNSLKKLNNNLEELRSKIEILSHEKKDLFASSIEKSKSLGTLDLMIRTLEETPIFEIEKPLEKKKTKQKKHLTVIK